MHLFAKISIFGARYRISAVFFKTPKVDDLAVPHFQKRMIEVPTP